MLRVNEEIKQNISLILMREIEDPRIRNNFVTITKVDTAKDLRQAKVYFICLDPTKKDEVLRGLFNSKGVIFGLLKRKIRIRYTPNLSFTYDDALIETNRILQEIHQLNIPAETPEVPENE